MIWRNALHTHTVLSMKNILSSSAEESFLQPWILYLHSSYNTIEQVLVSTGIKQCLLINIHNYVNMHVFHIVWSNI